MKNKDIEFYAENALLEEDLKKIRVHLQEAPIPMPSSEFFEETRSLCHARLKRSSVPKFIWVAFAALLILTGILMLPLAKELGLDRPLSLPMLGVLILVFQNLLMLFFTPVVIQKFRSRKKNTMNGFIDKEVCHG
jgi:hypothetical protein